MISYLKLRLDVWPCDVVVMELNYNKKLLSYTVDIEDPMFLDTKLEGHYKGNAEDWLDDLDGLDLDAWKDIYNGPKSGDVAWKLDYQERGMKNPRHIQGKDAFPDNFGKFIALLSLLAPDAAEDLAKWQFETKIAEE